MKRIVPLVFVIVALLTPLIAPMTFGRSGPSLGVIAQEMQDRDGDSIPDSEDPCPDDPADECQVEAVGEPTDDGNETLRTTANTDPGDSRTGSQAHVAPASNVAQGQISGQAAKAPKPSKTPVPTKTLAPTKTPVPTKTPRPTKTVVPSRTPVPTRTLVPTRTPTEVPTIAPTQTATFVPTVIPSVTPTEIPTEVPTQTPTEAPTQTPTEVPTQTPTEVPTETPTEVPTEVPTETPTEVPTETVEPTPTPCVDVVTGNLIPSSGPQLEGMITLEASGSSSCGYPLTYWWNCFRSAACSAFLTATSSGNVSTYQFPILDGQHVYITLWVCSVGPTGGCTPPISRDYDGVWLG